MKYPNKEEPEWKVNKRKYKRMKRTFAVINISIIGIFIVSSICEMMISS